MHELDELDEQLLQRLQSHGLQDYANLARILYVSERTVRRRILSLKDRGIIRLASVLNPVMFGYEAWVKIGITTEPRLAGEVAQTLAHHPKIYFVARALGRFDYVIAAFLKDVESLTEFVYDELNKIPGILGTEANIMLQPRKYYGFQWPALSEEGQGFRQGRTKAVAGGGVVDEIDQKILSILQNDALAGPKDMVAALGLGEATIRKRIANMLEDGVYEVEVVADPQLLARSVWATIGICVSQETPDRVIDAVIDNPAVYLATVTTGRYNVMLSARFPNLAALNDFLHGELLAVKGVSTIESIIHGRPIKYHNITWTQDS